MGVTVADPLDLDLDFKAPPLEVRHHVMENDRRALCGAIAPWEGVMRCPGTWRSGEVVCPECGVPYCAGCLKIAEARS